MSYILEALRRADRDRRLVQTPDAAPQAAPAPLPSGARLSVVRIWARAEYVAMALLAAAGFWWWLSQATGAPETKVPVVGTALPSGENTAPAPATAANAASPVPAGAPFITTPPPSVVAPMPTPTDKAASPPQVPQQASAPPASPPMAPGLAHQPAPATVASPFLSNTATPPPSPPTAPRQGLPAARAEAALPSTKGTTNSSTRAAAKTPASASAASPIVALADLPADVRQQLPALKLGGSIHSSNRADRLLIVDGQVAHEGDVVAPGVVLEQIQPRSAVFRFRQFRYEQRF